jgi:hypothetical protein
VEPQFIAVVGILKKEDEFGKAMDAVAYIK